MVGVLGVPEMPGGHGVVHNSSLMVRSEFDLMYSNIGRQISSIATHSGPGRPSICATRCWAKVELLTPCELNNFS